MLEFARFSYVKVQDSPASILNKVKRLGVNKHNRHEDLGNLLRFVQDNSLVLNLEPLHGILLGDTVLNTNTGFGSPPSAHSVSWAFQDNVEIHTVDTCGRIVPEDKWA